MWMLLPIAFAHGPAPAVLEVLAWAPEDGCAGATLGPLAVRTNIGAHRPLGDGTWDYGCPARWGDAETALVAADPTGRSWVIATGEAVFRSDDSGCNTVALTLPVDETPFALRWWRDRAWLITRNFTDASGSLWEVDDDASLVRRWTDLRPDGLLADGDKLWVSGAQPFPTLLRFDGAAFEDLTPAWPTSFPTEGARLDRLAPRALGDGGVWLVASAGAPRVLWWTDGATVTEGPGPATSLLGPARVGAALVATLDGVLWTDDGGGWASAEREVDWTCLQAATDQIAWACAQDELREVHDLDGDERPTFALAQLGAPSDECAAVEGACANDWSHYGGESGFTTTLPASCPDLPRVTPLAPDPEPPTPGCSCGHTDAAWSWPFLALLGNLRRRRA